MKKLSILLALVLSFNIFAASNVSADTTEAAVLDSFDFNAAEGTALPKGLTEKTGYTNVAYTAVDEAHGNSMKFAANSGFRYVFPETAGDTVTLSFEVMKKENADARFHVINDSDGTKNGNGTSLFSLIQTYMDFQWWRARQEIEITPGRWYQVDLVITNTGTGSTVEEYVDGWCANTNSSLGAMNAVSFLSTNNNEVYVDNLVIRNGKYVTEYPELDKTFDFELGLNTSGYANTGTGAYATLPVGFTRVGTLDASSYVKYATLDEAHGVSMGIIGSAGSYYKVQESQQNKPTMLSFELRVDDISGSGQFYIKSGINNENNNYWQSDALIILMNGNLYFTDTKYATTIEKDKWVKIDLLMTPSGELTYFDCFVNGTKINQNPITRAGLTEFSFWSRNRTATTTYIDNLKLLAPFEAGTLNAAAARKIFVPELEEDSLTIVFDKSVNKETWDESLLSVATADGQAVAVDYVEWNDYATELKIYLENGLDYSSQYVVTLPEGLASVYGDVCSAAVTATTAAKLADFEDFSGSELTNRINFPATEANAAAVVDEVMTIKAGDDDWCEMYYDMPYEVTDGVVKVSFDHYIEGVDSGKTVAFFKIAGTNTLGAGIYWLEDADGVSLVPSVNWVTTGLSGWQNKNRHHYDLVFDLDNKTFKLYMDGVLGTVAADKYAETITRLTFGTTGTTKTLIDNLSVKYYDNLGGFETDLTEEVDCSKETINISFKDAVDVTTLEEITLVDSKGNLIDTVEVTSTSIYDAAVAIGTDLAANETYTLSLERVKTLTGDAYADTDITFKAVEKFEVTGVKLLDGTTVIESVSEWDAEKSYTLSVDVENSTAAETTIYVLVAGYSNDKLENVQAIALPIAESRTYEAALGAVDMKDATVIKIFALDNLEDLAPIMVPPVQL